MSSKNIYVTIGIDKEVFARLVAEAEKERRTKGFIVEDVLREHFQMPWGKKPEN